MITFKLQGMKELLAQLKGLEANLAAKTLTGAARKAFKPVLDAAKAKAPIDSGLLFQRLRLQVIKPKGGDTIAVVGLRLGKKPFRIRKKVKKEARNWAWYEHGVPAHGIAPKPFLRPALDERADQVLAIFQKELAKRIERVLAKGASK